MTQPDLTQPPADHVHTVNNGKRDLTLDQLAATQPGLDRLMAELGPRMHRLYFAGRAGNWRLADYFFRSVVKQLSLCAFSRPKYEEAINTYITTDCEPVRQRHQSGGRRGVRGRVQRDGRTRQRLPR